MKTILVAVDFTEASHNAAKYATELARAFHARLVIFNAYVPVPMPLSEALVAVVQDDQEPYIEQRLKDLTEELDPSETIDIEMSKAIGRASDGIRQAARQWQADLIVMGMKHMHHDVRRIFGSTVTALIGKIAVPLLIIPEEASFKVPGSIALATNSDIDTGANSHIADALCEIGHQFRSKLYVVRVVNNVPENGFQRPEALHNKVESLWPEYVYPYGIDVSRSLQQFVEKKNIDILAMIPHQHTFFEKLFLGSQTKAMAFATHIPLLVLPEIAE
ncbi:MAG: universal stress protein [Niastella sp.]|nr:universal stress protein [Niastella sp.]